MAGNVDDVTNSVNGLRIGDKTSEIEGQLPDYLNSAIQDATELLSQYVRNATLQAQKFQSLEESSIALLSGLDNTENFSLHRTAELFTEVIHVLDDSTNKFRETIYHLLSHFSGKSGWC
jgi:hypothetical protein